MEKDIKMVVVSGRKRLQQGLNKHSEAYPVKVHFSETSKETMSDKIKRILRNEVSQMT